MMNLPLQPHYCKTDVSGSPLSELYNMDCILGMKHYPDKYFDLAIVDPPYGIGASEMTMGTGKNKKYSKGKNWDNETPLLEYFIELFRVSANGCKLPMPLRAFASVSASGIGNLMLCVRLLFTPIQMSA